MLSKQELGDKFTSAGYGRVEITDDDLKSIGINKVPKYIKDWEMFCRWVYKKMTKQEMERCHLRGRGFRSQWHGRKVTESLQGLEVSDAT